MMNEKAVCVPVAFHPHIHPSGVEEDSMVPPIITEKRMQVVFVEGTLVVGGVGG